MISVKAYELKKKDTSPPVLMRFVGVMKLCFCVRSRRERREGCTAAGGLARGIAFFWLKGDVRLVFGRSWDDGSTVQVVWKDEMEGLGYEKGICKECRGRARRRVDTCMEISLPNINGSAFLESYAPNLQEITEGQ